MLTAYRVVTLTGPGGIGKTVLASEVARRLFPTLKSDVILVELASLSAADLLPSAVANVLNLQLGGEETSPASIARALGDRKILLVFDNCEHVIDVAAETVETLVQLCPNAVVLATSREVLGVEGEVVFRVAPLEAPAEQLDSSERILQHSAVQLFLARTQFETVGFPCAQRDASGDRSDLPAARRRCRSPSSSPRARAATLGVQEVADHLDDRFGLLTNGRRTALPRHRTLRATLDWSYELLPGEERDLLHRLAIFPAGFTLKAAAAVTNDSEAHVAGGISSLVSKSLVTLDRSETTQRWRLLETVRAYAIEKFAGTSGLAAVMRRQAEFYLGAVHSVHNREPAPGRHRRTRQLSPRDRQSARLAELGVLARGRRGAGSGACRYRDRLLDRRFAGRRIVRMG